MTFVNPAQTGTRRRGKQRRTPRRTRSSPRSTTRSRSPEPTVTTCSASAACGWRARHRRRRRRRLAPLRDRHGRPGPVCVSPRAVKRPARPELVPRCARGRAHQGRRARHRRRPVHRARRRPHHAGAHPPLCVVQWDAAQAERAVERLRNVAREAALSALPDGGYDSSPPHQLRAIAGSWSRPSVLVADPTRAARSDELSDSRQMECTVVVGLEGGLDPGELARARPSRGYRPRPAHLQGRNGPIALPRSSSA